MICNGNRQGHDHLRLLARERGYGHRFIFTITVVCMFPPTAGFADLIEVLLKIWPLPVKELVIIGHSMGGWCPAVPAIMVKLPPRLAAKIAQACLPRYTAPWRPLERGGNWVDVILGNTLILNPSPASGRSAAPALPIFVSAT
ncbi:MAG: hypothetical protein R2874_06065 [Desulfobacterales bacterium]